MTMSTLFSPEYYGITLIGNYNVFSVDFKALIRYFDFAGVTAIYRVSYLNRCGSLNSNRRWYLIEPVQKVKLCEDKFLVLRRGQLMRPKPFTPTRIDIVSSLKCKFVFIFIVYIPNEIVIGID